MSLRPCSRNQGRRSYEHGSPSRILIKAVFASAVHVGVYRRCVNRADDVKLDGVKGVYHPFCVIPNVNIAFKQDKQINAAVLLGFPTRFRTINDDAFETLYRS